MSKRFTDNEKWRDDWFLDLPTEYKFAWLYILDNCDHAGVFKPNFRMFSVVVDKKIDKEALFDALNVEKERLRKLSNGRWFIEDFIVFQYGVWLNPRNRVHESIIGVLDHNDIKVGSIRGLKGVKGGSKDIDKDKDIEKGKDKEDLPWKGGE